MGQILFPLFDEVIFAPIHSLRATTMSDLLAAAEAVGVPRSRRVHRVEAIAFAGIGFGRHGKARSAIRLCGQQRSTRSGGRWVRLSHW